MKRMLTCAALLLAGCQQQVDERSIFTLYRTSIVGGDVVHVATFDAKDGAAYNQENCEIVAALMRSQPGVTVAYGCTLGRHRD